jgi:PST family polysaccharide transporter
VNFGINGFTEAIIQQREINDRQISTLFWVNLAMNTSIAVFFMAISPLIAWFYGEPRLKLVTVIMAIPILFTGLSTEHMALLKRKMRFHRIAANDVGAAVVSVCIAIAMASHGWGYWAIVARQVIVIVASAGGAWILCRWSPGWPSLGTNIKPMVRFAFSTYGNFCLTYFNRNLDKVLIGQFHGSQPLGYYDRAYHLSSILPNQLAVPLTSVAVATLSRLRDDPEKYVHYYARVLSMLAFISMPLSVVFTIIGRDLIILLLGPQWGEAGKIFCAFGPGIGMAILYGTHGWLHLSLGKADRWFRWGLIAFITTIIFYLIGLPFGALGVAVAYSGSFYVLIGPALSYAGKPINLRVSFFIKIIWKYWVAAVLAGFICWVLFYLLNSTSNIFKQMNILVRILASSILCLLIYLMLIIVFHKGVKPISQFLSILRDIVAKP